MPLSTGFLKLSCVALLATTLAGVFGTLHFRAGEAEADQEAAHAISVAAQYQHLADSRLKSLEAVRALWADDRAALETRAEIAERHAKQYKEQRDALSKALRDNSEWSDTPIPDGVLNALRTAADRPSD